MALFSVPGVRIAGIASAVPQQEFSNRDYEWISEKERELFIKTVGVERRHMAPKGMATSDLCEAAARRLVNELGWDFREIELLIFISQSRDHIIPATAGILQDKLGMSRRTIAYDVSLGCSGFVYGLSIAGSQMATGQIRKALLMVGDVSTFTTNYKDKSTYPLFGDAGSVTALELDPGCPPMHFNLQTDGSGYKAIIIPDGGIRNLASRDSSFNEEEISEGIIRTPYDIALDGMAVFQFSLREVGPNVNELLNYSGKQLSDIDYFVFHQANRLMNESIRKKMGIPAEKYPYSMEIYGNTSSASIPLTINHALREQVSSGKLKLLLSGFGVGLSWGSVFVETSDVICPEILEI
jgi:3-oxoacyl-[acyl-carrier-protein] synthase-3